MEASMDNPRPSDQKSPHSVNPDLFRDVHAMHMETLERFCQFLQTVITAYEKDHPTSEIEHRHAIALAIEGLQPTIPPNESEILRVYEFLTHLRAQRDGPVE